MSDKYRMGEYPYCVCAFPIRMVFQKGECIVKTASELTGKEKFKMKLGWAMPALKSEVGPAKIICGNKHCGRPFDPTRDK